MPRQALQIDKLDPTDQFYSVFGGDKIISDYAEHIQPCINRHLIDLKLIDLLLSINQLLPNFLRFVVDDDSKRRRTIRLNIKHIFFMPHLMKLNVLKYW
jgi:hypothetical protein